MINLFRYIGLRHLRLRPARTLLTLLGVAFGVALYVAIAIINRSTLASFRENIDAVAGKATLIISGGESGFPEEKIEAIRKTPGVKHVAPMIETRAYFTQGSPSHKDSETLVVLGVDLLQEQAVRTYKTTDEQIVDDPLVFLNQPDSIIITHSFAKAHGLGPESTFELATADGTKRFTVRGQLSPEGPAKAYGGAIAIMDIDGARFTFGKEGKVDRADLITSPDADVEKVAEKLREKLGPGYTVERPEGRSEAMEKMVSSYQTLLTVFSTLALIVGLFLVANSVSISVAERRREIGTLRAVGATRTGILTLILGEAVATGFFGAALGCWLGWIQAGYMVHLVAASMSGQYLTRVEVHRLIFTTPEIFRALLIGSGAAFVAAAWPASKSTRIGPLDAMRRVDSSSERRHRYSGYGPALGLLLLGFYAVSSLNHFATVYPWFSWLDQAGAMLGSALLGPAIVMGLVRLLTSVAIPAGGTVTRLAGDNLLRSPRRTGSNVMTLMVGLILVTMISIVNMSFRSTILDWFGRLFRADLVVSSAGKVISFQTQPLREEVGRELSEVPGVKKGPRTGAYGMRFVHILYEGRNLGVKAYDEPDPALRFSNLPVQDRPAEEAGYELFRSPDPAVMVSRNFVLHFNRKTGDHIQLDTPSGRVEFRIVAVIQDFASSEGVLYLSRDVYKRLWKDPLVSLFSLSATPGYDPIQLRAEIDRRFGRSRNLMTVSNADFRKEMVRVIDQSFAYTQAIQLAALLVGLLGLFNTFLISVMERTREFGMLRAIGMSRSQLSTMVVLEAIIQGVLGALAAVALGSYIAFLWIRGNLTFLLGWIIDFHFPWQAVVATVGAGLLVGAMAAIFPALRAANLIIREAIEYE